MGAVGMLAGREIRRRWLRLVALTWLVGVVGAVVLSTAAGARRSDTALARFNAWSRSSDVQLAVAGLTPPSAAQVRALNQVDGVVSVASARQFGFVIPRAPNLGGAAAADTRLGAVVDRARIVVGRAANPSTVNEINIGEGLAAKLHLGVGSRLDVATYSSAEVHAAFTSTGNLPASPAGPRLHLRIVGIERRPLDLGNNGAAGGIVIETPAFNRYYANRIGSFGTVLRVRTRQGATDVPHVVAAAKRIFAHAPQVKVTTLAVVNNSAQDAINVLSVALWIFAGVVALAGGVAIAIILTREISLASVDQATLRALGLSRRQRAAINGYPALLIAGGGALISVVGAIAASPLFPFGVARRADPHLGVHVDWVVVVAGVVAVALVVGSIALVAALRSTRGSSLDLDASTPQRPSRIVERAARAGLAPTTSAGLRMALEPGRGRTAVPVRSAYLGAVFGIAGLIAVFMFASSVQHLAATPRLYGWTADFAATDQNFGNEPGNYCGRIDYGLSHTAGIAAVASVCTQTVQLNGDPVTGYGFTSLRGTIAPEIAHGHAPRTAQEIALGSVTLHALNKHLGDTVHASGPTHTHSYRIVGQVVLPGFVAKQAIADGATFTDPGIQRIFDDNNTNRYFLIRFAPGANRAALEQRIAAKPQLASPTRPAVPPEVDRLRQINWFPATLAALLAALALLAVGHALVTSVRRRRRDLALFKTLGFNRRQVRATIVWQATTIATVGLIMGIPIGLLIGSFVWRPVADSVGVSTTAAFPALALLATIPAVLALVNLLAYFPARAAAHIRPAIALRTE
jgi:ABC-type lipoprotein release transport system permease subunit